MTEALGLVSSVELFAADGPTPTAVICGSVRIAKGVYQALNVLGLSIPQDVSVLAHDDHLSQIQTAAFFPALSVSDAPRKLETACGLSGRCDCGRRSG